MKALDVGLRVSRSFGTYEQCFCPFHHDVHPSAVFYNLTNSFYCFVCQKTWTIRQLIEQTKNSSISPEEIDELMASAERHFDMKSFHKDDFMINARRSLKMLDEVAEIYIKKERGISEETAHEFGVMCTKDGIAFLHHSNDSLFSISGFVTRLYHPPSKSMRYIKLGELETFWPLNFLKSTDAKYAFVTEGPFKTMKLKMALDSLGMKDAISLCSFGLKFDKVFAKSVQDSRRKFVIVGDPDIPGRLWAQKFKSIDNFYAFTTAEPFDDVDVDTAKRMVEKLITAVETNSQLRRFDEI